MSRSNFTGKRALITGASSGIGVEFADLLAARKVNLVLAARRREPMENSPPSSGASTASKCWSSQSTLHLRAQALA